MHNSGTMDVPHHMDSMTDSSESLDDDQMLFETSWSPMMTPTKTRFFASFSMFVMNCFDKDEAQYEHKKWGVGLLLIEKRRFNMIFKVPSKNWRSNISVEKLQHIYRGTV